MTSDNQTGLVSHTVSEYVDNGLLFFIVNKINFMTHDDIIDICKSFYNEADIEEAKSVMYAKYNCPEQAKTHRGANKSLNDLKEMVSFLAEQPAPRCVFCITKCTQIPSVAMDYIDAASLNTHIAKLRGEVSVSSTTLRRLISKVERIEADFKQAQQLQHMTLQKECPNKQQQQEEKQKKSVNLRESRNHLIDNNVSPGASNSSNNRPSSCIERSTRMEEGTSAHPVGEEEDSTDTNSNDGWQQQRHQRKRFMRKKNVEERKLLVENRPQGRRPAVIGTRTGSTLTAARPLRDVSLFVSRLSPDVGSEVLCAHVESIAGVPVGATTCEQLPQRHQSYVSFKVTISGMPKENIASLYEPENWDKDILVKRWFN